MIRRRLCGGWAFCWLLFAAASTARADDVVAVQINGEMPKLGAKVGGSGSGIIVGPGLVLTNRHVATQSDRSPRPGFRIRTGENYGRYYAAKVVWICENYDLALLATSTEVTSSGLPVLNVLPELGSRVTAYGFPLGDEFGIGLTVTGGQITRHPVPVDDENDGGKDVKRSMWHDAVSAGGSSGGPLFASGGVLVGVHWGSFKSNGNAFSVPAPRVAEFLKAAGADRDVKFVNAEQAAAARWSGDPKTATVYIEIMGSATGAPTIAKSGAPPVIAELHRQADATIAKILRDASADELQQIRENGFRVMFPVTAPHEVKPLQFARIKTEFTLIQVRDDWWLIEADGVKFKHYRFSKEQNAEWRAKFGDDPTPGLTMDDLVLVGRPEEYPTVGGSTAVCFPLFAGKHFFGGPENLKLVEEAHNRQKERKAALAAEHARGDQARRDQAALMEQQAREQAAREEQERQAKATQQLAEKYRRLFVDVTGTFRVDALCTAVDERTVTLFVFDTKKSTVVERAKLSAADREWITENERWVRLYSSRLAEYALKRSQ